MFVEATITYIISTNSYFQIMIRPKSCLQDARASEKTTQPPVTITSPFVQFVGFDLFIEMFIKSCKKLNITSLFVFPELFKKKKCLLWQIVSS